MEELKEIELKQRIEKTIEYLENFKKEWDDSDEIIIDINKLLSILKGW